MNQYRHTGHLVGDKELLSDRDKIQFNYLFLHSISTPTRANYTIKQMKSEGNCRMMWAIYIRYSAAQWIQGRHKYILTLNITKCCNCLLTKLTKGLMLMRWLSGIVTLLHISFTAKAQRAKGNSLRKKKYKSLSYYWLELWHQHLINAKSGS
jgi:hypothetical protein